MTEENPYSAPMSSSKPVSLSGGANQGIWRDGKRLVVHRDAILPPICVKTNESSQRKIKRKYYWHHPAIFLAVLLNILIYIVLAIIFRKRHDLAVPVSAETASKRRNWIAIGWVLGLGAIALLAASIAWMAEPTNQNTDAYAGIGIFLSVIMLLVGVILGQRAAGILFAKKMTASATWFSGAHPEFLERFPEVPPNA